MRRAATLYQSSVGKKILMATTGTILFLFVFVHMIGNLKIYLGPEHFNAYAEFLRTVGYPALAHGQFLWAARIVLLFCVGVHLVAAFQLWIAGRAARGDVAYRKRNDLSFSYASRTMRWGGVIIALFVIYHLLDLTIGTVHPGLGTSVYDNVVASFRNPWVAGFYIVAMIPLALHIYHGLWSVTQTLDLTNPKVEKWRRPTAAAIALIIALGNISIPVAVLAGVLR